MGGSREVSTRETLGSRIHEKDFISLEPAKKKNTTATVEEIPKMAMLRFSVFLDVSGFQRLFHGMMVLGDGHCLPSQGGKIPQAVSVKQLVGSNIMKVPCNSNMSLCLNLSSRLKQLKKHEST